MSVAIIILFAIIMLGWFLVEEAILATPTLHQIALIAEITVLGLFLIEIVLMAFAFR